MRGPAPKPPSQRLRRNKRNDFGTLTAEQDTGVIPIAPTGWLSATVSAWADFWQSPVAAMVVKSSDLDAVRRLFDYKDEHARMLAAYKKQRITTGSMGQTRLSPNFEAMQKLEKLILPLEDRFAGSPMARLRLGAELGAAHKSLAQMNAELEDEGVEVVNEDEGNVIDLPGLPDSG